MTQYEQEWNSIYNALIDNADMIQSKQDLKQQAFSKINRTTSQLADLSLAFKDDAPRKIETFLNTYGMYRYENGHPNYKDDDSAYSITRMAIALVKHGIDKEKMGDVFLRFANAILQTDSSKLRDSLYFAETGFSFIKDNPLPEAGIAYAGLAVIDPNEYHYKDEHRRLGNLIHERSNAEKTRIADLALENLQDRIRMDKPASDYEYLGIDVLPRVLKLGSSDNQKAATNALERIAKSYTSASHQADDQFSFLEEALQNNWLTREQGVKRLNQKMIALTDDILLMDPQDDNRSWQGTVLNTGNSTLFYLASLEPEQLLAHQYYVVQSEKLIPNYNTYTDLNNRLGWLTDGTWLQNPDNHLRRLWNAERTTDDITDMRQSASQHFVNLASRDDIEDFIAYSLIENALELDPQNHQAVAILDKTIEQSLKTSDLEDPVSTASNTMLDMLKNGLLTQEVAKNLMHKYGMDAAFADYMMNAYDQTKAEQQTQQQIAQLKALFG